MSAFGELHSISPQPLADGSHPLMSQHDAWVMGWATKREDLAAAHWDGNEWLTSELPAKGAIYASAANASDDIWVGGNIHPLTGANSQQVMLHYAC